MNRDFVDLLRALSSERAEFLLIGGYAVGFHTEPRYTKDLDVLVRPTRANAKRVMTALKKFGAPIANLRLADLLNPDIVYQVGLEPNRVDFLTEIPGVIFTEAWKRRVEGPFGELTVPWLSAEDLLANKKKVARPQDLLDAQKLELLLAGRRKKPR